MTNKEFNTLCTDGKLATLSEGNKKLVSTEIVKFLIWNIPAITTCPHATELCKSKCYALKAERLYPNVAKSRARNYEMAKQANFVNIMLASIAHYMNKASYKNAKAVYFRIHEAGDLFSYEYTNKWLEIVEKCKALYPNLYFNLYTKSIDYLPHTASYYKAKYPNLIINISIWADSPASLVNRAYNEKWNIYTAAEKWDIDKELVKPGCVKCRCADCGTCTLCLTHKKTPLTKICEIH